MVTRSAFTGNFFSFFHFPNCPRGLNIEPWVHCKYILISPPIYLKVHFHHLCPFHNRKSKRSNFLVPRLPTHPANNWPTAWTNSFADKSPSRWTQFFLSQNYFVPRPATCPLRHIQCPHLVTRATGVTWFVSQTLFGGKGPKFHHFHRTLISITSWIREQMFSPQ